MNKEDTELPSLAALDAKIQATKAAVEHPSSPSESPAAHAMRMGVDMVSGAAVGTILGYFLDTWLGTMPLFLLLFFCLGLAAGVRLMMQSAAQIAREAEKEAQQHHPKQ